MIEVKKFYADWCGPCRMLTPTIEKVKSKVNGVTFTNIDVDAQNEIATKYGVRSIPLVVIEKDGEIVEKVQGAQSEQTYLNILNKLA